MDSPKKHRRAARFWACAAVTAALYAALTALLWQFSSLQIQCRASEVLCVLPALSPAAIPGLFVGCLLGNLLSGNPLDIVFGSLATLVGALGSYLIARVTARSDGTHALGARLLIALPPVLANAAIIPLVLYFGYGLRTIAGVRAPAAVLALTALSVALGEALVLYAAGVPFLAALEKMKKRRGEGK